MNKKNRNTGSREKYFKTRNATAVDDPHLKIKDKDFFLSKNHCITISSQKICSIHKFIFKIQQILGLTN